MPAAYILNAEELGGDAVWFGLQVVPTFGGTCFVKHHAKEERLIL
jgi:hypothetical protein